MLPDFPLPVRGLACGPRVVVARDLRVCEFFHGFPDSTPMTACYAAAAPDDQAGINRALESWIDGLLTRAIRLPRLTRELVQRLGAARDDLATAYLRIVGWLPDGPLPALDTDQVLLPERREPAGALYALEALAPYVTLPGDNAMAAVRLVAKQARTAPHEVWRGWSIADFCFTWHCAAKPVMERRDGMDLD